MMDWIASHQMQLVFVLIFFYVWIVLITVFFRRFW
nr:MAG TPA_asm: protein of unknown function (DUF4808) [Inoviridae sp.]